MRLKASRVTKLLGVFFFFDDNSGRKLMFHKTFTREIKTDKVYRLHMLTAVTFFHQYLSNIFLDGLSGGCCNRWQGVAITL